MKNKNKNFGFRLSEAIANKKITQGELARRLGTSPSLVSRWRNEEVLPGSNNYKKLATILNVSMEWLMTGQRSELPDQTNPITNTDNTQESEKMLERELMLAQKEIITLLKENALLKEQVSLEKHKPSAKKKIS